MEDLSLKYRPRRLNDVLQPHVVLSLSNAIRHNKLSHCYLFSGPKGTGKTTVARLLAASGVCDNLDADGFPCGECKECRGVITGTFYTDVIEINAAQETGKDAMWEKVNSSINIHPLQSRKKVYILDECHSLSSSAQNSLLKSLEEPPAYVLFILCTTDPHKVLPTIIDRSIHFEFRMIPSQDIMGRLSLICNKERIAASSGALKIIAREANGSMRRAFKIIEKMGSDNIDEATVATILGKTQSTAAFDLLDHILRKDRFGSIKLIDAVVGEGKDVSGLLRDVIEILMDVLRTIVYKDVEVLMNRSDEEQNKIVDFLKLLKASGGSPGEKIDMISSCLRNGLEKLRTEIVPPALLSTLTVVEAINGYEMLSRPIGEGGDIKTDAVVNPSINAGSRKSKTG